MQKGRTKHTMLNVLWGAMILIGILWGAFHGTLGDITEAVLGGAKDAVNLSVTMLGILSFWTGILEIGQQAGLITKLTKGLRPFLRFLFPRVPADHPAAEAMATNIIANMLGLGWAATPAGLKAMEQLGKLQEEEQLEREIHDRMAYGNRKYPLGVKQATGKTSGGVASNEMCIFLILNMSSLQLIPINMIAYRSQYGSANPALIVGPALLATAVSTVVAVIFCKLADRRNRFR